MRVLVVEDDKNTKYFITAVLRRSDPSIQIDSVPNGDDALALYTKLVPTMS